MIKKHLVANGEVQDRCFLMRSALDKYEFNSHQLSEGLAAVFSTDKLKILMESVKQ